MWVDKAGKDTPFLRFMGASAREDPFLLFGGGCNFVRLAFGSADLDSRPCTTGSAAWCVVVPSSIYRYRRSSARFRPRQGIRTETAPTSRASLIECGGSNCSLIRRYTSTKPSLPARSATRLLYDGLAASETLLLASTCTHSAWPCALNSY